MMAPKSLTKVHPDPSPRRDILGQLGKTKFYSHAGGWSLWRLQAIKSIFRETVYSCIAESIRYFFGFILNLIFTSIIEIKISINILL